MTMRKIAACIGVILASGALYLAAAGSGRPFVWLGVACTFGFGSAFNFGAFDSNVSGLTLFLRVRGYLGIAVCLVSIVTDVGKNETLALSIASVAATLFVMISFVELYLARLNGETK